MAVAEQALGNDAFYGPVDRMADSNKGASLAALVFDMPENEWLGLTAAAEVARVSRSTFNEAVRRGEIPYATTPLGRLYGRADCARYAADREAERLAKDATQREVPNAK